jgi:glycosyltransferase involved in cell wall biosynthesis
MSIINALLARGHRVHVIAFEVENTSLAAGAEVQLIKAPPDLRFVWRMGRALHVRQYEAALREAVLPAADQVYTQSVEFGLAYRRHNIKTPVISHLGHVIASRDAKEESSLPEPWRSIDAFFADRFDRWSYGQPRWTHVVSTKLVADVRCRAFGLPDDFFKVQPLGIDVNRFSPRGRRNAIRSEIGLERDDVAIVCVARLVNWKNHSWIIRAMRNLPPRCIALMVGDGPERERLSSSVPPEMRHRIRFTGHQDPLPYLEASDVFALPSTIESFGVAYAEAMCMGLPCIGLRCSPPQVLSSAQEVIQDGVTGFVVEDERDFLSKLQHLCTDTDARIRMGTAARAWALERFDVDTYAAFLEGAT